MAQRRRGRRSRRVRVNKDRAWVLGSENLTLTYTSIGGTFLSDQFISLLEFEDISAGEASLSNEVSEWCVKRLLLDFAFFGSRDNEQSSTHRFVEWLFGVFPDTACIQDGVTLGGTQAVIFGDVYDASHRIIQTGLTAWQRIWTPADVGVVLNTTGGAGVSTRTNQSAPNYGQSLVSLDLSPSFRLREDDHFGFAMGPAFGASFWDANDVMDVLIDFKILCERKQLR